VTAHHDHVAPIPSVAQYGVARAPLFVNQWFTEPQCRMPPMQMQPRSLDGMESAVKQTAFSMVQAAPLIEIDPAGAPAGGVVAA